MTISKVPRTQVVEEVVRVAQVPETWALPEKMFARHGKSNVEEVHNWWSAIGSQVMGGTGNLSCVAGLQLFLDFYLTTQHQGPWVFKKRWYDAEQHVPVGGRLPWGGRVKAFLMLFKVYMRHQKVSVVSKMTHPSSSAISKWLVCYKLRYSGDRLQQLDDVIFRIAGKQLATAAEMAAFDPLSEG